MLGLRYSFLSLSLRNGLVRIYGHSSFGFSLPSLACASKDIPLFLYVCSIALPRVCFRYNGDVYPVSLHIAPYHLKFVCEFVHLQRHTARFMPF